MKRRIGACRLPGGAWPRRRLPGADTPVDLQLVLAVDVSRSIDEVEAELQRRGYVEALTNDRVIDAILSGEHRRIALCYTEWAGTHYQVVVIDWSVIDSAAGARRFADKLAEAPRTSQSWTAVGAALAHAGQRFENSGFDVQAARHRRLGRRPHQRRSAGRDRARQAGGAGHRHQRPAGDDEPHQLRPAARPHARQVLRGERDRRARLLHDRGRQLRPFRPRRAHQAGARDFVDRRHPAPHRPDRPAGAIFLAQFPLAGRVRSRIIRAATALRTEPHRCWPTTLSPRREST